MYGRCTGGVRRCTGGVKTRKSGVRRCTGGVQRCTEVYERCTEVYERCTEVYERCKKAKTLAKTMRRAHRRRAESCQISLFGALRVSTGIRPSVPIIAVLHTAVCTSISSRSGHSHAMPSSRSALCARSSCTCKMVWPERRAGVELSQKCFVRITSMLAVQWHATKRAWCATVLFIHHCDASTHRRLQSW